MSQAVNMDDFQVYELLDSGERSPMNVVQDNIKEILNIENVLLILRLDLRRLFIWKGPKSPVRKRFISSREGSKLQEELAKYGMHLKIVSVDAGDEPAEFLQAFRLEQMEIAEADKMEDLRYIRNEERRKMEEAEIADKIKAKKEVKMPSLDELKSQSAPSAPKEVSPSNASAASIASVTRVSAPIESRVAGLSSEQEKVIMEKIIKEEVPAGYKRLNIVIGTSLYGPQKVVKKIFGKEVESEEWGKISSLPSGKVDIPQGFIRAYMNNNIVEGLEVLQTGDGIQATPASSSSKQNDTASKKRQLPPIPKGE